MIHVGSRDTKEMTPVATKEPSNEDNSLKKRDYNHSLSVTGSKSTTQTNVKSERPSKVSFEMQRANSLATGKNKIPKLSDEEKKILEKSIRSAENFDKICVLLGKSKQEVENYLSELGEFKVINS